MANITNIALEYNNEHRLSRYPFADTASLESSEGLVLPLDAIIDLMMYPIDMDGALYLSMFDAVNNKVIFSDADDNTIGIVDYTDGDYTVYEYIEAYDFKRPIGKIVINKNIEKPEVYYFDKTAEVSQHAYYNIVQKGIRGIVVNDKVYTGSVKFTGVNGVLVNTYKYDGDSILSFNAIGEHTDEDKPEKCEDDVSGTIIGNLCFKYTNTAAILPYASDEEPYKVRLAHRHMELVCSATVISKAANHIALDYIKPSDGLYTIDTEDLVCIPYKKADDTIAAVEVSDFDAGSKKIILASDVNIKANDIICIYKEVNTDIDDYCYHINPHSHDLFVNNDNDPCVDAETPNCLEFSFTSEELDDASSVCITPDKAGGVWVVPLYTLESPRSVLRIASGGKKSTLSLSLRGVDHAK